jgi:hypothetical protein
MVLNSVPLEIIHKALISGKRRMAFDLEYRTVNFLMRHHFGIFN